MILRVARTLLLLSIAFACLVVLHKAFRTIETAPYLNVDDSIPDVAVSLATYGRYGFLASPTQGPREVDRTHAFFNYGPLYFYAATILAWVLGPSLLLFRLLHPLGLIVAVGLWLWVFRKVGWTGAVVLVPLLFQLYLDLHWPLARPDIAVSICAVLLVASAGVAIRDRRLLGWAGAGFFAASAATSHQIAGALVPAAFLILAVSHGVARGSRRERVWREAGRAAAAAVLGACLGLLVYLIAIDFRVRDIAELMTAGMQAYHRPFFESFRLQFSAAWLALGPGVLAGIGLGIVSATLLTLLAPWMPAHRQDAVLAWVMPPLVVAVFYQVSLGMYSNVHSGYAIVSHVTVLWTIAATASLLVRWVCDRFGDSHLPESIALLTAAIIVFTVATRSLEGATTWEHATVGRVKMTDYIREVLLPIPERGVVWGSLAFGADAGRRTELVQFQQAFNPAFDMRVDRRGAVVPDFLALGGYEFQDAAALTWSSQDSALRNFFLIFPAARFHEIKLTYAPPYGTTVVYERDFTDARVAQVPSVAINDGAARQWSTRTSEPLPVRFASAPPVTARITHYSREVVRDAAVSIGAELDPGFYLIAVDVARSSPEENGFLLASQDQHYTWADGPEPLTVTPYLVGATRAWMLVDHPGGTLFISRFRKQGEEGAAGISISSVRRIIPLTAPSHEREAVRLPELTRWEKAASQARVDRVADGSYRIDAPGKARRLLVSPAITLRPHERMTVTFDAEVSDGAATLAAVPVQGHVMGAPIAVPGRLTFESLDEARVVLVLDGNGRIRVHDSGVLTPVTPRELYIDRLLTCRSPYIAVDETPCLHPQINR